MIDKDKVDIKFLLLHFKKITKNLQKIYKIDIKQVQEIKYNKR